MRLFPADVSLGKRNKKKTNKSRLKNSLKTFFETFNFKAISSKLTRWISSTQPKKNILISSASCDLLSLTVGESTMSFLGKSDSD